MLLLRQFLSELHDVLTNVPLYGVSICSSRIVDPGLMTSLMTSSRIIIVATLGLNISETRPDSGMVSTYNEYELAYGLSIAHGPDDFTWLDDVIMVTSRFISLKCFFSANSCQNWTILEHNVPLYYAVSIWSSRIVDPGLMRSLMMSSRIIIVATLGLNISETRPDSAMISTYSE